MADTQTRLARSANMAAIRSTGNLTTEIRFIQLMRQHKISGWRRGSRLPGRPDFVFKNKKLTVFVDGDFWHGNSRNFHLPKTNIPYWRKKIHRNKVRDKTINRTLKDAGWEIVRVWESTLRKNGAAAMKRLAKALNQRNRRPKKRGTD